MIDDEVSHVGAKPDKRNIEQMISYIKGALGAVEDDVIVVETGGIGLAVHVPLSLLEELPALGEEVTVYTYFQVREDAMTLYGFLHRQDREMFKQLIGVNGIGPKGALGILSIMRPDDLRIAIVSGDAKAISKAPGIGAKTAQRLILDLKDKVDLEEVMMASFGRSFLPPFNEGSFTVSISTLPGISLEESDKIGRYGSSCKRGSGSFNSSWVYEYGSFQSSKESGDHRKYECRRHFKGFAEVFKFSVINLRYIWNGEL